LIFKASSLRGFYYCLDRELSLYWTFVWKKAHLQLRAAYRSCRHNR